MTQALLLNNFNISQTTAETTSTGGKDVSADNDFQMLFEEKTSQGAKNNLDNKTSEAETKETDKSYTLGSLKEYNPEILKNLAELLQESLPEETPEELPADIAEVLEQEEDTITDDIQTVPADETETTEETEDEETSEDDNGDETEDMETSRLTDPVNNPLITNQEMVQQNTSIRIDDTKSEDEEDELKVTLNGKDIDTALEEFGIETEEIPAVNITKPETDTEIEDGKTLEDLVDEETIKDLKIESLEAESGGGEESESDLMQNQTPEEQGVKAIIQTDVEYNEIKTTDVKPSAVQQAKTGGEATPGKIIEQISKQLEGMYNGSKVNIVLNPESLGKVSVQLINTPEGLSAQFTVTTQEARNLIMKGLDGLKDNLISHGVSVDNVSVKLNDTQESEYNADWTEQEGSRGGNKEQHSNRGQKNKQEFEQMMAFAQNDEI